MFSQAIESVTPDAICAQAFSVAARNACASLAAAAVRHADRSWNAIQTSHRYRLVPIVEYTTTISTNTTNAIARITVLLMERQSPACSVSVAAEVKKFPMRRNFM